MRVPRAGQPIRLSVLMDGARPCQRRFGFPNSAEGWCCVPGLAIRCFSRKRPALPGGVGAGAEIGAVFCNVDGMRNVCGAAESRDSRSCSQVVEAG